MRWLLVLGGVVAMGGAAVGNVCFDAESGREIPCPDARSPKPVVQMGFDEAQTFLRGQGCTLHPELDPDKPEQVNAQCSREPGEVILVFARAHDRRPARCVMAYFKAAHGAPDWRAAITRFSGADASRLPEPRGPRGKEHTFRLYGPTGTIKIGMSNGDTSSFSIGDGCE